MSFVLPPVADGLNWSIAVRDLATGEVIAAHHSDQVLVTASIGKLFVLVRAATLLLLGEQDPDAILTPGPDDLVADSGLLYLMRTQDIRFSDACLLVGAVSDNLATNLLIESMGLESIHEVATGLGYENTNIFDKVRNERTPDMPPTLSRGSADDLSDLMWRLATATGIPRPTCNVVNGWLAAGADTSMVAGGFGIDPLAHIDTDDGMTVRHKTGTISNARCDTGWVHNATAKRGVSYAMLSNWAEKSPITVRLDALAAMHATGVALREYLVN